MEVLITSHVKYFLAINIIYRYCSECKGNFLSARNVYEKNNETKGERFSKAYLEPTRTSMMKIF